MFAHRYELGYLDNLALPPKNPVLERLLPSLLHIKAVAILDHALRSWCEDRGYVVPKKPYGTDLKGRIDYLADNGHLADRTSLHSIRGIRNELAHEPTGTVDWDKLDIDVRSIHMAFQELGLVLGFPNWRITAERTNAPEPRMPDAAFTFDYQIVIWEGERRVADIKWSKHVMKE